MYTALPIMFYYDHHNESLRTSITDKINEFYFQGNLTIDQESNFANVMRKIDSI